MALVHGEGLPGPPLLPALLAALALLGLLVYVGALCAACRRYAPHPQHWGCVLGLLLPPPTPQTLLQLWLPTEGGSCTQRRWSGGEAVASEEPTRLSYPRGGDAGGMLGGSRGAGAARSAGFGMEVELGVGLGVLLLGGGRTGCLLLSLLPAHSCFSGSQGRRKKVPPDGVKLVDEVSWGGVGGRLGTGGAPGIPARA